MTGQAQQIASQSEVVDTLLVLVAAEGSGAHRHFLSDAMQKGPEAARNAADVVHHLALLHGRQPGVIDHAAERSQLPQAQMLLVRAADGFAAERALLARLVVAVGPIPSTPGQADAESAVLAQHHAIDMLARSDRNGCALGAALALHADWIAIRTLLDDVARRLGVTADPVRLDGHDAIITALASVDFGAAAERAMVFGAQQIVAQHRGLWDLLEARALARNQY